MKLLANLITIVFNPQVFAIVGVFLIALRSHGDVSIALKWTGIALAHMFVLAIYVLIGIKRKTFTNIDISRRQDRLNVFIFIAILSFSYLLFVYFLNGPIRLFYAVLFFLPSLFLFELVNRKIKASIHLASVTFLLVGLGYFYGVSLFFALLTLPFVAWARIKKQRHTLEETVVGSLLGGILALLGIIIVELTIHG